MIWSTFLTVTLLLIEIKMIKTNRNFVIHWNSTNPIFRIDKNDNVIDVNEGNANFDYDQLNIICPLYPLETANDTEKSVDIERYIIYNVSKEEYDNCMITNQNPKIIAICDKPYKLLYFTVTFREFSPQPNAVEFKPGHDYYFISTSKRGDIDFRKGGRCVTHNMKVTFKIARNRNNNIHNNNNVQIPQFYPRPSWSTNVIDILSNDPAAMTTLRYNRKSKFPMGTTTTTPSSIRYHPAVLTPVTSPIFPSIYHPKNINIVDDNDIDNNNDNDNDNDNFSNSQHSSIHSQNSNRADNSQKAAGCSTFNNHLWLIAVISISISINLLTSFISNNYNR